MVGVGSERQRMVALTLIRVALPKCFACKMQG